MTEDADQVAIVGLSTGKMQCIPCRDVSVSEGHLIVSGREGTVAAYAPGWWSWFCFSDPAEMEAG